MATYMNEQNQHVSIDKFKIKTKPFWEFVVTSVDYNECVTTGYLTSEARAWLRMHNPRHAIAMAYFNSPSKQNPNRKIGYETIVFDDDGDQAEFELAMAKI